MAGFTGMEGFDFEGSAQVKQKFQEGLQAALTSGNPDRMGAANMQQIAFTLSGGTPEFRAAKKKEKVLTQAAAEANAEGGEDEIENEMLFYQKARDAAIEADLPEIAMTATQNLSQLRVTQEQRSRLKAQEEDRDQLAGQQSQLNVQAIAANEQELDTAATRMIVDAETGKAIDSFNMKDADAVTSALEEIEGSEGRLVHLGMEDYFDSRSKDRLARAKMKATLAKSGSPSHIVNAYAKEANATRNFVVGVDSIADIIRDNPDGLTVANKAQTFVSDMATNGRAIASASGAWEENDHLIDTNAELAKITDAKVKSATIEVAFAIASSREGGKLTDRDIQAAIETIGMDGNPNPAALAAVLHEAVKRKRRAWGPEKLVAMTLADDEEVTASQQLIHSELVSLEKELLDWSDSFKEGGANFAEPAAPPVELPITPQSQQDQELFFGAGATEFDTDR